jgi:hypothetical protein
MNYLKYVVNQVRNIGLDKCYVTYYPNDKFYHNLDELIIAFVAKYGTRFKIKNHEIILQYNRKVVQFNF